MPRHSPVGEEEYEDVMTLPLILTRNLIMGRSSEWQFISKKKARIFADSHNSKALSIAQLKL